MLKEKLLRELTEIALDSDNIETLLKKFAIKIAEVINLDRIIIGSIEPYSRKTFSSSNFSLAYDKKYLLSKDYECFEQYWKENFLMIIL